MRQNVAAVLGKFGNQAKPTVAALMKAVENSDTGVHCQAAAALKRINSGAVAN
jgi:HEAT repeat protein